MAGENLRLRLSAAAEAQKLAYERGYAEGYEDGLAGRVRRADSPIGYPDGYAQGERDRPDYRSPEQSPDGERSFVSPETGA